MSVSSGLLAGAEGDGTQHLALELFAWEVGMRHVGLTAGLTVRSLTRAERRRGLTRSVIPMLKRFVREESGQTTVEYAIVISVLSIALLSSFFVFTGTFATTLEVLAENLQTSLMDDGIRK